MGPFQTVNGNNFEISFSNNFWTAVMKMLLKALYERERAVWDRLVLCLSSVLKGRVTLVSAVVTKENVRWCLFVCMPFLGLWSGKSCAVNPLLSVGLTDSPMLVSPGDWLGKRLNAKTRYSVLNPLIDYSCVFKWRVPLCYWDLSILPILAESQWVKVKLHMPTLLWWRALIGSQPFSRRGEKWKQ